MSARASPTATPCAQALREALRSRPARLPDGRGRGRYGGTYAVAKGLLEEFGPERIRDTPLSELGFVGAGIGAALGGMRPIVEIMTVNFSLLALDQIVNNAAMLRAHVGRPVLGAAGDPHGHRRRAPGGGPALAQFRGLVRPCAGPARCWRPATVEDARGMLTAALADPDPVLIFEHAQLYNSEGELPDVVRGGHRPRAGAPARAPT